MATHRLRQFLFLSLSFLGLALAFPAPAAVLTVTNTTDSSPGSLRQAIAAAANGDTIQFDAGVRGSIVLKDQIFINKSISLVGPGKDVLALDGNMQTQILNVSANPVSISGLSFIRGSAPIIYGSQGIGGGAIQNGGSLSISSCSFIGNSASPGVPAVFFNSVYSAAGQGGSGGAITNNGTLSVSSSSFVANAAGTGGSGPAGTEGAGGYGGAIFSSSSAPNSLILSDCVFQSNRAGGSGAPGGAAGGSGGAICSSGASIKNCTFLDNQSALSKLGGFPTGRGGALFELSGGANDLTNCTFTNNRAGEGGAIYANSSISLLSCTLSGNSAVSSSTLARGGGLSHGTAGTFSLRNTIVAGNSVDSGGIAPDLDGTFVSLGHNLIGVIDGSTGFTAGVNGDLAGSAAVPLDPVLGTTGDNGGLTPTRVPLAGSPALEAGDDSVTGSDQRGAVRPAGAHMDIGAVERVNSSVVSFAMAASTGSELDGVHTISVVRTESTVGEISIPYVFGPAGPVAADAADYVGTPGILTFADGETMKEISIPIVNDGMPETTESFVISLVHPTGAELGLIPTHTVLIPTQLPPAILSFLPSSVTVAENAGTVQATILRTGNTAIAASVHYATVEGAAKSGIDYTGSGGTVSFAAGETQKTITVTILDDGVREEPESFSLVLSQPATDTQLGSESVCAISIQDNDHLPTVGVVTTLADNTASPPAGSLRQMLLDASDGDTIQFAPDLTGTLTLAGAELLVNRNVTIAGPGQDVLAIAANKLSRVFRVSSGVTASLSGLTIRDGQAPNGSGLIPNTLNGGPGGSGGALINEGELTVAGCVFKNNATGYGSFGASTSYSLGSGGAGGSGGAIQHLSGTILVKECSFSGNKTGSGGSGGSYGGIFANAGSGGHGGAIQIFAGTAIIQDCAFTQNAAGGGSPGGFGGAIANLSPSTNALIVERCVFQGNSGGLGDSRDKSASDGGNGGAIFVQAGTCQVSHSTFFSNRGGQGGSTSYYWNGGTLYGGSGGSGGALALGGGSLLVDSSTLSGNGAGAGGQGSAHGVPYRMASGMGGAACVFAGRLEVISGTLNANLASDGGAIYSHGSTAITELKNTLVAANASNLGTLATGADLSGTFLTGGHNLIGVIDGSTGLTPGANGDVAGTAAAPLEAKLGPLANNGGPTPTLALLPNSPAIDAGDDTLTGLDQRGQPRLHGSHVDIGAVEHDSDEIFSFAAAASVIDETAGSVTVTVTRAGTLAGTASVDYAFVPGSAGPGDFVGTNGTLEFPDGVSTRNLIVPIVDDISSENNESFTIVLASPINGLLAGILTHTVTIQSDDAFGVIAFPSASMSVSEGAGSVQISVVRTGGTQDTVTVNYATSGSLALAGADYVTTQGTLTFAPGETSKVITVPLINDTVGEVDETFSVTLSAVSGGVLGNVITKTITIADDDHGIFSFAVANSTVAETVGTANVIVQRTNEVQTPMTVQYATTSGSALAGNDFTSTGGTLSFAAGETEKTIPIPILDDLLAEGDETFTITLSAPGGGAVLGAQKTHIITIQSDEVPPPPSVVAFAAPASTVSEAAGNAVVTVLRSGDAPGPVSVLYFTTAGTATTGQDFVYLAGVLWFSAGETQKTISVPIFPDALSEGDETFTITLSPSDGSAVLGAEKIHTVTILGNDQFGTLAFAASASTVDETAGAAAVTVTRTGATQVPVSVQYSTTAGTATAGQDFTTTSGTLSFSAGETQKTISVPIAPDALAEGDETFTITLSAPGSGAVLGATQTHTVTIRNVAISSAIALAAPSTTVLESAGTVGISVQRIGDTQFPATVAYATSPGTALAGSDFTATSGTLSFSAGETQKTISVPILDDTAAESSEHFFLTLSSPGGGAALGASVTHTVTIRDDDVSIFSLAEASSSVSEAAGFADIVVRRRGNLQIGAAVSYILGEGASGPGRATLGSDFTDPSVYLGFAPGETEKTIRIPIVNDALLEGDETFTVRIFVVGPPNQIEDPAIHTVTILDDDEPGLRFDSAVARVKEGQTSIALQVHRSGAPADISVPILVTEETAHAGRDFVLSQERLVISLRHDGGDIFISFPPTPKADGPRTFTVQLVHEEGGPVLLEPSMVRVTIEEEARHQATFRGLATCTDAPGLGGFTITTTGMNRFTGMLQLQGQSYRFRGSFNTSGEFVTWFSARVGHQLVYRRLELHTGDDDVPGTFTMEDGTVYALSAERAKEGSRSSPVPEAGYYTALLNAQIPEEARGYLTATIRPDGSTLLLGTLPDGTVISQTTSLTVTGHLPLYLPYPGRSIGFLGGNAALNADDALPLGADLLWNKPTGTLGLKSRTFNAQPVSLAGARYTPRSGRALDDFDASNGAGTLGFSGAGLSDVLTSPVTLGANNRLLAAPGDPQKSKLVLNAKTGLFTGSFVPADGHRRAFKGALVQQPGALPDFAQGFFVDPTGAGVVELKANQP